MNGEKLRILSVANVPPDPNSGAGGTVLHTNIALQELGHEVDALWREDLPPRRIAHGNLHSLLEQPRSYRDAVLARLRTHAYDVIQFSQPQAALAARALRANGFPGIVVNRSHGVELRVDTIVPAWHRRLGVRESRAPWITSMMRRLLGRQWHGIARYCDGVMVSSEMDREFLVRELSIRPDRVLAAAEGVAEEFRRKPPTPASGERSHRLLYVGQFSFIKAPDLLVQIVNRVLGEEARAEFTWVCGEHAHEWIRARLSPQVAPRVTLQANLPLAELSDLTDRHGIFVFPSFFEGFGKAPVEAMARGLCVIASDDGGMHDCIAHGQDGWLCRTGDVDAFVGHALRMLRDPDAATAIGRRAIESSQRLTWRACAEKATDFYRRLLAEGRH